jgi:uncharacterized LabA/DUF88 family protein
MSGVGLFIDGANLSIAWRSISAAAPIDFTALRACVEDHCGDRIVEAYCFDATEDGRTNAYFRMMEQCGIRVKLYWYAYEDVYDASNQRITDRNGLPVRRRMQKGVDVGLATHMLESRRRKQWTHLVLAAADADFAEPVQRLVESDGVALTLLGVPERVSHALRPYATDDLDLRKIKDRIACSGTTMLRPTG